MPASGILINQLEAGSLAQAAAISVVDVIKGTNPVSSFFSNPFKAYRPPTWSSGKTQYSIVVPNSYSTNTNASGNTLQVNSTGTSVYVFDAVWRANHKHKLNLTEKPVQTGFNISDNAIQQQPVIMLEIGMSDTMDSFESGMWTGNKSKSISAFLTMEKLMINRVLITLNTRLKSYNNVMLYDIEALETAETQFGLRLLLTFKQLFISTVASQILSARPQATGSTQLGTLQSTVPDSSSVGNFKLPNAYQPGTNVQNLNNTYGQANNAGMWSSNPTNTITSTLGNN